MQQQSPIPILVALVRCWMPAITAWGMVATVAGDGQVPCRSRGVLYAVAGAATVYSADRLGDPLMPDGTRRFLLGAIVLGLLVIAYLLPGASWRTWIVIAGAGSAGLLHRWVRHWVPKNVVVSAAWTAVVTDAAGIAHPSITMLGVIAVTMWSACLLCDFKDDAVDAHDGTITLARVVGSRGRRWAAFAGLVVAVGMAHWGQLSWIEATAAGLVPLALVPSFTARPIIGPIVVDGTLALPGLIALYANPNG